MKRIMAFMTVLLLLLLAGVTASAESAAETNRRLGYFENTRTVLLIPASYRGQGDFAAAYVNKSMKEIFRYPYYRLIDDTSYAGNRFLRLCFRKFKSRAVRISSSFRRWHCGSSISSAGLCLISATILSAPGPSWIFTR